MTTRAEIEAALAESDATDCRCVTLGTDQLRHLLAEVARLQAERDRAMTTCGLLALDLRSCEEERDALRAELAKAESLAAELLVDRDALRAAAEQCVLTESKPPTIASEYVNRAYAAEQERDAIRARCDDLEREYGHVCGRRDELLIQVAEWDMKHFAMRAERDALRAENERLTLTLRSADDRMRAFEGLVAQALARIAELEARVEELQNAEADARDERDDARERRIDLRERPAAIESELTVLEETVKFAREELVLAVEREVDDAQ